MAAMEDTQPGLETRLLDRAEMGQLHALTLAEGWYCTLADLLAMYDSQPEAFQGTFSKDGTLLCSCMGYIVDKKYGYISFYITHSAHRGKGIGKKLFKEVMTSLGDRNIVLDAVSEVGHMYSRFGFSTSKTEIMKLRGYCSKAFVQKASENTGLKIRQLGDVPFDDLLQYDTSIHLGIERSGLLSLWINSENAQFRAAYNDFGALSGFAVIRETATYFRLSALYADDEQTAVALLLSLLAALPDGTQVTCLTPGNNYDATLRVLTGTGMTPEKYDHETRMYTRTDLPLPSPKVFCFLNTSNTLM